MDVGGWLRSLGLGQYEALFRASEIDADILPELTEVDLVLAESLVVSLQPEPPQPDPNVHRVVPALVFGA